MPLTVYGEKWLLQQTRHRGVNVGWCPQCAMSFSTGESRAWAWLLTHYQQVHNFKE